MIFPICSYSIFLISLSSLPVFPLALWAYRKRLFKVFVCDVHVWAPSGHFLSVYFLPLSGICFPVSLYALWFFCCCWKPDSWILYNSKTGNQILLLPRDLFFLYYLWKAIVACSVTFWSYYREDYLSYSVRSLKSLFP